MFPEGLIAQDGRLRPGDQIIEINGVDMTCANHLQVIFQQAFYSFFLSYFFLLLKKLYKACKKDQNFFLISFLYSR